MNPKNQKGFWVGVGILLVFGVARVVTMQAGAQQDVIGNKAPSFELQSVTGDTVTNDNLIVFGEMSAGGPITVTDVGLGFATGNVLQRWGQVTIDLVVNNGVNPQLAAGALDITAD